MLQKGKEAARAVLAPKDAAQVRHDEIMAMHQYFLYQFKEGILKGQNC